MGKLQNVGASVLWFFALVIFASQTYRAVMYYVFERPISWTWHDVVLAMIAFAVMFVPAKLKSIVVSTLSRVAGKR